MTAAYTFGDIEPDDAWAPAPPDPEQVTYRLHELRTYLDALAGDDTTEAWEALDAAQQTLALSVGALVVAWLVETDPDDPERAAQHLHDVRRYWSRGQLVAWDELPDDARAVAVALLAAVIDWLRAQGLLG